MSGFDNLLSELRKANADKVQQGTLFKKLMAINMILASILLQKKDINAFLRGKKRLYMTVTPRIDGDESKSKATENNAVLCSMDKETIYGKELYSLEFL